MTSFLPRSFALFAGLLALLSACGSDSGGGSGSNQQETSCQDDGDCRNGESCVAKVCQPNDDNAGGAAGKGASGAAGKGTSGSAGKGTSGSPGTSGSGGSPTQGPQCDPSDATTECGKCGANQCCDEISACSDSDACVNLLNCLNECTTDACSNQCVSKYPDGVNDLQSLLNCYDARCSSECDSGPASCEGTFTESACGTCIEGSCCAETQACLGDAACSACLQGDDSKCSGSALSALNACTSAKCSTACDSGPSDQVKQECADGVAVFCYCRDQAGAGTCTDSDANSFYNTCLNDPTDKGKALYCAGSYYKDKNTAPNCTSFANGCL